MKRFAILIASCPKADPIPGVYSDLDAWTKFLQSHSGGVWNEKEVKPLRDPSREQLRTAIELAKTAEYSLLVFAGHGETVKTELPWTESRLFLNDTESVLERDLNPGTPRCALVLDCCRRRPEQTGVEILVKEAALLEQDENPVKARVMFDEALRSAEGGVVKVYATEEGSAAADKASFSQYLLYEARKWATSNHGVLSIPEGVALATETMRKTNPQQRPRYNGGRRLRHFPLATRS